MTVKPLVLVWRLVAVGVFVLLAAPLVWEKLTGDYFMTVTGSSMKPTYSIGDVLVVQKPTGNDLDRVGSPVVVSKKPGDRSQQYVHRIDQSTAGGAVLRGDNNPDVDPGTVKQDLVMGTPRIVLADALAASFRFTQSWGGRIVLAAAFIPAFLIPARGRSSKVLVSATTEK
jgi:signal peptidase I